MDIDILPFVPEHATPEEGQALTDFYNQMRNERWPGEPDRDVKSTLDMFSHAPPNNPERYWLVREQNTGTLVAVANADWWQHTGHNEHMVFFRIDVLAPYRQQGIATRILPVIVAVAHELNRKQFTTATDSLIPAGEIFMQKLNATPGLPMYVNRLDFNKVDLALMQSWVARGQEKASEFELGFWIGPIPETDIADFCKIKDAMNSAPTGDLDFEDMHVTPEEVRENEAMFEKKGLEHWVAYVRHKPSGEIAGFTEAFFEKTRPHLFDQDDTGVEPKFRGLGLGRWLKAAMLLKALRERPGLKYALTGNAHSNAPMLKINNEMGFYPYKNRTIWQVSVDHLQRYLDAHRD